MEPFGLLNFIKSALALSSQAPKTEEENSVSPTPFSPAPSPQTANMQKDAPATERPNAFLEFIETHDKKAKKFRK